MAPRVPYAPSVEAGYIPREIDVNPDHFGANVGRAVVGFGGAVSGMVQAYQKRQRETEDTEAAGKLAEFNENFNLYYQQALRDAPASGDGFANGITEAYHERANALIESLPERLRPEYKQRLTVLRGSYSGKALSAQFVLQDAYATGVTDKSVSIALKNIDNDPSQLEAQQQNIYEMYLKSTLPDAVKEEAYGKAKTAMQIAALRAKVRTALIADPNADVESIAKSDEFSAVDLDMRDKVVAGAKLQADKTRTDIEKASEASRAESKNGLYIRLHDGEADASDIEMARSAGVLQDYGEIAQAENILKGRRQKLTTEQLAIAKIQDPTAIWTSYSNDDRKMTDALLDPQESIQRLHERDPNYVAGVLIPFVQRTKMVNSGTVDFLRGAIKSQDPTAVKFAMSLSDYILRTAPGAFSGYDGGKAIEDMTVKYNYFTENLGYSLDEAAAKFAEENTPEFKDKVSTRVKGQNIEEITVKNATARDLRQHFSGWFELLNRPILGAPELESTILAGYHTLFEDYYRAEGDVDKAKSMALARLARNWGVSEVGGQKAVMRFPPEKAAALANIPEVGRLITNEVVSILKTETGETLEPNQIRIQPLTGLRPGQSTRDTYFTNNPPIYKVQWQNPRSGEWHTLMKPYEANPDVLIKMLREEQRLAVEAAQAGGPPTPVPPSSMEIETGEAPSGESGLPPAPPRDTSIESLIKLHGQTRPSAPPTAQPSRSVRQQQIEEGAAAVRAAPRAPGLRGQPFRGQR